MIGWCLKYWASIKCTKQHKSVIHLVLAIIEDVRANVCLQDIDILVCFCPSLFPLHSLLIYPFYPTSSLKQEYVDQEILTLDRNKTCVS